MDQKSKKINNQDWLVCDNGIRINMNWLYPPENRKPITEEDWDEDECQNLTIDEQKKFFGD